MIVQQQREINEQLIRKTFEFSLSVIELYISLLRKNEFDLSKKLLASGTSIRKNIECSLAATGKQEFLNCASVATKEALEARYWLKMVQMKHFVSHSCDTCVEQLNEIINTLNYIVRENNKYKLNLNLQNLN